MLKHKGTITLETKRLVLRRFNKNDAAAAFHSWTGDSDILKYMRWKPHKNKNETRSIISRWIIKYYKPTFYQWAIEIKETKELIGTITLFVINEYDLCGDVGYCIGKKYWGKGIATEALNAVLKLAFMDVGFNRIETYHSISNPASGRVMEKCGMKFEGIARQKYKSISGFEDSKMYAILKEDYLKMPST